MKQYPIWNEVYSRAYGNANSKSFGAREDFRQTVYVGTSAKNSHQFAEIQVTETPDGSGGKEFRLYLDGVQIKKGTVTKDREYKPQTVNG